MPPTWLIILIAWTVVAGVLGVLIGKSIRNADRGKTTTVPLLEQPITVSLRRRDPARWGR